MSSFKFLPTRTAELKPRIVVFGVGGAGGNAVNNMIEAGLEGVEFVVANTDAQQLAFSKTECRIQLGVEVTQGLGAGAHPEVGMSAAEESNGEIGEHPDGAHMVFITAGMGGGTGTGAAPVIARAARERGILTVGVVTKPFHFEGRHRMRLADAGIAELQRYVDTLIVIPNQNLFRIANERTTFTEAFGMADQVLHSGVRSITDLMVLPGLINLDFADVRTVMTEMGKAMMGTGEATGDDRALMAAQNAIQNPLLDEVSLRGAKAVLVNVTGGLDMTLLEVDEACNAISEQVDDDANIIFGAVSDPTLEGTIRVAVVATGMDTAAVQAIQQTPARTTVAREPAADQRMVFDPPAPEPARTYGRDLRTAEEPVPSHPRMTTAAVSAPVVSQPVFETPQQPAFEQPSLYRDIPVSKPSEPAIVHRPAREPMPVARIVDPLVEEIEEQAPLIPGRLDLDRGRARTGGGWGGIFGGGRHRHEAQNQAPASVQRPATVQPAATQAPPIPDPSEAAPASEVDDLEIPAFLRRLAN